MSDHQNHEHSAPTQADTLAWVRERWPDHCTPLHRAAKLCEEAGEVMGAVIKTGDGTGRKSTADVAQETAQLVICAMALAESVGFDLNAEVAREYARCQVRQWTSQEKEPLDHGFAWIGQSWSTCENCGRPAAEHPGMELLRPGTSPFDLSDEATEIVPWEEAIRRVPLARAYGLRQAVHSDQRGTVA